MTSLLAGSASTAVGTAVYGTTTLSRQVRSNAVETQAGTSDWAIQNGWKDIRFRSNVQAIQAQDNQLAARRDHRVWFADLITQRANLKRQKDGRELLTELATIYGFAWADVGRLLGVSVPAIRKWRMSGGIAGENVSRLAHLMAFVELLRENTPISSPAAWFNTPLMPGYTVTPKHIYTHSNGAILLDYVDGNVGVGAMLDELAPNWASEYNANGYEVRKFEDGSFGIVRPARNDG